MADFLDLNVPVMSDCPHEAAGLPARKKTLLGSRAGLGCLGDSNLDSPVVLCVNLSLYGLELYGCESRTMKKEDENILRSFERKIIRRIYGPLRQGREWRRRDIEEIDNIIRKKDIVRFVKARRMSWIGHVERMEESRMPKRVMRKKFTPGEKGVDQRLDG
jgi:hypothetical protein